MKKMKTKGTAAPTTRIVLPVSASTEHGVDGYDCFVVDITPEYAARLVGYIELTRGLKALNKDVYELRVWDYSGDLLPG